MKSQRLSTAIMYSFVFMIGAIWGAAGCVTDTQYVTVDGKPIAAPSVDYRNASRIVPPGADQIVELGNKWFIYKYKGNEYMMRIWYGHHVGDGIGCTVFPLTKPCACATINASKEVKNGEVPGLVE